MDSISLGIPLLDDILPRGIPTGSHVLLKGPLGCGKSYIVIELAKSWIMRGSSVVYVSIDDEPEYIMDILKSIMDPSTVDSALRNGNLVFIDLFTPGMDLLHQTKRLDIGIIRPRGGDGDYDVKSIIEALSGSVSKSSLIVIDSLNELILRAEPRSLLDFIKSVRLVSRLHGALALSVVHTGNDVDAVIDAVEFSMSGILEVDIDPTLQQVGLVVRRVRVRRMRGVPHSLNYVHFDITDKGLVLVDIDNLIKSLNETLRRIGVGNS